MSIGTFAVGAALVLLGGALLPNRRLRLRLIASFEESQARWMPKSVGEWMARGRASREGERANDLATAVFAGVLILMGLMAVLIAFLEE